MGLGLGLTLQALEQSCSCWHFLSPLGNGFRTCCRNSSGAFLRFPWDFLYSGPGLRQEWLQKSYGYHPGYSTAEDFLIVCFGGSAAPALCAGVEERAGDTVLCFSLSPSLERACTVDSRTCGPWGPAGTISSTLYSFEHSFFIYKMVR